MKLYSLREAAEYLGLKPDTLKYHVHRKKNLSGQVVGGALVFTQDQLDEFKARKRPPGRPPNPR